MIKWFKGLFKNRVVIDKNMEIDQKIEDSMFFRKVLDGLGTENLQLSDAELNQLADTFLAEKGSPISNAWEKIFKYCLVAHQWEMSHIPSNIMGVEKAEKVTFIQGRIAQIEALLQLPRTYMQIAEKKKNKDN